MTGEWRSEENPLDTADGSRAILMVDDLHVFYGNIPVLKGVSLDVGEGEIVTLIGGNGAGKTTLINTIAGILPSKRGTIVFKGQRIDHLSPHEIVRAGISQVPEGRKIYDDLTVSENLRLGAFIRNDGNGIRRDVEALFELFPRLGERSSQKAGSLSGGEQQMLSLGRALMARPRLLLLDEPSMGLAPMLVDAIFKTLVEINKKGTTILLVEQNAAMAFTIASRGYVIQSGEIALEKSTEELREDAMVRRLYLGMGQDDKLI